MLNNANTNIERIIAKIDNDFNPDNSDWIPRVGAWCIDAMGMMNVLRKERKRIKLRVKDRIAYSDCPIDKYNVSIYDANGCKIKAIDNHTNSCCGNNSPSSTGGESQSIDITPKTIDTIYNDQANYVPDNVQAVTIQSKDYSKRYNVVEQNYNNSFVRNYVIVGNNKIELNYDTDCVWIEQDRIITEKSSLYNCELPVIPNNALLIEALVYYCMYKMLTRGYKHPVLNLHASQYGTNPKYEFDKLKDKVERSIINNEQGDIDTDIWGSAFFLQTFRR